MAKLTEFEKKVRNVASNDWNNQCKRFMQGIPFRDNTARKCYERHLKEMKDGGAGE